MANNRRKKKKLKIFIIIGIVVVIAAFVVANILRNTTEAMEVMTEQVEKGSITQIVSASGKIRPVIEVKISAKVSGNITALYADEGDSVKNGDLLLELDRERYIAVVERAQSGLKSAEASLWKAEAEFNRLKELYEQNLTSEAELQTAEAQFRLSQSNVEQARAGLREAQDDLSKTRIFSPMKGVVSQMNKESGEMVLGASFQEDVIMVLADLSKMEAEVEVDENDVVDVSLGDQVSIEIDAFPDTTFRGKVTQIANTATTRGYGTQDEITNFLVKIAVLDYIDKIRPGMSATADIEVEKHDDVLHIPIQCVALRSPKKEKTEEAETGGEEADNDQDGTIDNTSGDKNSDKDEKDEMIEVVFVVADDDTARMVPVVTGISSDTDIEIISGLEENQKVVSGPYRILADKIQDGDVIKIKENIGEDKEE